MRRIHATLAAAMLLILAYQPGSSGQSSAVSPSGLTIITHGFQCDLFLACPDGGVVPGWVWQMVSAIADRSGVGRYYHVRYDVDEKKAYLVGPPGSEIDIRSTGSAIVVLDWADASNELASDYVSTKDVADSFFDFLFGQGHQGHNLAELPIHLIGHSRGASLNSRLAYRLAQHGILIEHVTSLDPHPVTAIPLQINETDDWEVTTYKNTIFADNYYRTGAPLVPVGYPVPGAHENDLTDVIGGSSIECSEHAEVHTYYHGTINLTAETDGDCAVKDAWYDGTRSRSATGFNFSRLAGGQFTSSGINRYLEGGYGTGSRKDVSSSSQFWPNVGFGPFVSLSYGASVVVGVVEELPYYFTDRTSAQTITFFLDSDMNPFNGAIRDIGSVQKNAQTLGTIGTSFYPWTPIASDVGTRFIGVRTTNALSDPDRVRFDYIRTPVSVAQLAVTGISPSGGTTNGGTHVRITGTHFRSGATVRIGGALAVAAILNKTTIDAVTPPHAGGAADVYVENPDGVSATKPSAFTYVAPTTATPSVSTGAATALTQTGATLSATVNPNGASTTLYFDYGLTGSYGGTATYGLAGSGATTAAHFYSVTGLSCGTTYQYRARAQNSNGTTTGNNQAFTTSACSQQSGVELLTNGSFASGSSGWSVSDNFFADSRFSNCRTCPGYAYLSSTDGTGGNNLLGSLFQTVTIPANATSAALSFWYHITTQETSATTPFDVLNVTVQNPSGGFLGTIVTLSNLNKTTGYAQISANLLAYAGQTVRLHFLATTGGQLPTVFRVDDASLLVAAVTTGPSISTLTASGVNLTGATLGGTVNPNGSATTAWFQYGTTTNYGSSTASQNLGAGTSPVATSASVAGLTCGTLYHFRLAGQNGAGIQYGNDQTFTTTACGGSTAGTVRVSIVPQAAADAGAQWKLSTETTWHNSGAIVPVPSLTTYTVEFRTILGWTTPSNTTVTLSGAQTDIWVDSAPYIQQAILPLYENFSGIGFGSSEFVVISGGYTMVATPDGVAWSRRSGLNDLSTAGVNYAAGLWVVVGNYNAGRIMTSPNARDWTSRFTDPSVILRAVAFGKGLHVAAGNKVVTSPDAVNWTVRNVPPFGYGTITGIAFGNDTFVAVTEGGMALTSTDAVTWNAVTPPDATSYLGSVAYGNSLFVAVGWAGKIISSPDGINWVRRESGNGDLLTGVTWANGTFVAVGDSGRVVTSPDGVNWTSRNAGVTSHLRGVAFGNNTFVTAGWSGSLIPLGNAFEPLIVSQPVSQSTISGDDAIFSVAAAGTGPFTYQWQFEGVDLTGKTSASLTLQGVTPSQAGTYRVVVQGPSTRQVSQPVTLTINAKATPAIIWTNPAPIVEGTSLSSSQLNASSSVVGTFVYTPPLGAMLNVGTGQTLSVLFTPTDTVNYTTATASVLIAVTAAPTSTGDFFDPFSRPDGPVGNGWSNALGNLSGDLEIRQGVLTTPAPNGFASIYRPVDLSGPLTVSARLTYLNGFGGLRYRYSTGFLFGGSGDSDSGYGVNFSRADENYADSAVHLIFNGAILATARSSFQFESEITATVSLGLDGGIVGSVVGSGQQFDFSFGPLVVALPTSNLAITMGFPDGRSGVLTHPTVDDVYISQVAAVQNTVPVFTAQPDNQTVPAGADAAFTALAIGTPTPILQWQVSTDGGAIFTNLSNAAPYSGVTATTLTITAAPSALNGTRYRAVATNIAGSATSGAATLTVTVSGGGGGGGAPPPITLGTYSVGVVDIALTQSPSTAAADPSSSLPPGLSIRPDAGPWAPASTTGSLSGIATTPGSYVFTVLVNGLPVPYALKVTALTIKDGGPFAYLPDAFVGFAYSHELTALGNAGAVSWSAANLPAGMSLSTAGVLSGVPTAASSQSTTFTVTDGIDTVSRNLQLPVNAVNITTPGVLPNATQGVAYSMVFAASGGTGPYTYTFGSGNLPSGLSLSSSGAISGTPTGPAGPSAFAVTATDSNNTSYTRRVSLDVIGLPAVLPSVNLVYNTRTNDDCTIGVPCSRIVTVSRGGTAPFSWTASGLPPGVSIRSATGERNSYVSNGPGWGSGTTAGDGELWGVPTAPGIFDIVVTVTDAEGITATNTLALRVSTLGQPNPPATPTLAAPYSGTIRLLGGTASYTGVQVDTTGQFSGALPVGLTFDPNTLVVSGTALETGFFAPVFVFTDSVGETARFTETFFVSGTAPAISINTFANLGSVSIGAAYSSQLLASGAAALTWTIASGALPPGVSLSGTGLLSGTPTTVGQYTFLARATNSGNSSNFAARQFTLNVVAAGTVLSITTSPALSFGNVGTAYSRTLAATGGIAPLMWSVAPFSVLPSGITFSDAGVLSGAATVAGQFGFTINVTDGLQTASRLFTLSIYPAGVNPPVNLPSSLNFGNLVLGVRIQSISATNGTMPYTYSLTPGAAPIDGMRVQSGPPLPTTFASSAAGGYLGVLTTSGAFSSSIRVTDALGGTFDRPVTFTVSPLQLLSSSTLVRATVGVPYSFTLIPTGGTAYSWSASGLPAGLSLNASGQLVGTPTVSGNFFPAITLTDTATAKSAVLGLSLTVTPFVIIEGALENGITGTAYSQSLSAPGCGSGCTWSLGSALPSGLSLASNGVLSGTPTSVSNSSFTVQAAGSNGTVQKILSLRIRSSSAQALTLSNPSMSDTTLGSAVTVILNATGGTLPYVWSLQSGALPTGVSIQDAGETLGGASPFAPGYSYLSGRAMALGVYDFTLAVTDASNTTVARSFTWRVSALSNQYTGLPLAGTTLLYNVAYAQPLLVIGGTGNYTWTGGAMPPGLSLDHNTGVVSGTPGATGSYTVAVTARDSAANEITSNITFSIAGAPTGVTLGFSTGSNLGTLQAGFSSSNVITAIGGTPPYTITALTTLPPGLVLQPLAGSPSGSATVAGVPTTPGTYSYTIHAADSAGNIGVRVYNLTIVDTTAPAVIVPPNITAEATSSSGAEVIFTASASDIVDGARLVTCSQPSGSMFAVGATTVVCSATDTHGNTGSASFTVMVRDTTPPILTLPVNITVEASSPSGAVVNYTASATDAVDGSVNLTCTPASGATFGLGPTRVACEAADHAGHQASSFFEIFVTDLTAPTIEPLADVTAEATGPTGAVVSFLAPTTHDAVGGDGVATCIPASGSLFSIGTAAVTCTATDAEGNTGSASFTVTVTDLTPPVLTVPANNLTSEATGASGAVVNYAASAADVVDGAVSIACTPASGTTFARGTTTVNCTSIDERGNMASANFTVLVRDTTPPVLTLPANITVEATSSSGAVVHYVALSTDVVDGPVNVSCTPVSGATFGIGASTVNCAASDASGNTGTGEFSVTILSSAQIISAVISEVAALDVGQADNILRNVLSSLSRDNIGAACSQLGAFIKQIQAQSGKRLTIAEANQLVASATNAKLALGCP